MDPPVTSETPITPDEEAAFATYARATNLRVLPWVAFGLAGVLLAWRPLDHWLYADRPAVLRELGIIRLALASLNLALAVAAPRAPWLCRHLDVTALALVSLEGALLGWLLAGLGNPDDLWLLYLSTGPIFPAFVLTGLRPRVVGTLGMVAASTLGYLARDPSLAASPSWRASASYLLYAGVLSIGVGHLFLTVLRRGFVDRLRLARLSAGLESQLAERTAQIRRVSQHAESVREEERRRIASDLHDELGQELAAMRFAVAFARAKGGAAGPLAELDALLDRTHDTVRHLLSGLRPRALDELGLGPAVEALCAETARRSGLVVDYAGNAADIDAAVSTAAFRIVQEALTNTHKHARASRVAVTLRRGPASLTVVVEDDGAGLPADLETTATGLGLLGIRERARALGGEARWESGAGVRLRVELPLSEASP